MSTLGWTPQLLHLHSPHPPESRPALGVLPRTEGVPRTRTFSFKSKAMQGKPGVAYPTAASPAGLCPSSGVRPYTLFQSQWSGPFKMQIGPCNSAAQHFFPDKPRLCHLVLQGPATPHRCHTSSSAYPQTALDQQTVSLEPKCSNSPLSSLSPSKGSASKKLSLTPGSSGQDPGSCFHRIQYFLIVELIKVKNQSSFS